MMWAGIDWSDAALDFELIDAGGRVLVEGKVKPDAEGLADLFARLASHGAPGEIGIAIETSHGPWVQALMDRGFVIYPVNPRTADHFRRAMSASGEKSDRIDRHVLATFLASCHERLRPLRLDDPAVAALRIACEDRLRLVDERTAKLNELLAALKTYYPAIIGFFGDMDSRISLTFLLEFPMQSLWQALSARQLRSWLRRHSYRRPERVESMVAQLERPVLAVPEHLQAAKAERIVYLAQSLLALTDEMDRRDDEIRGRFEALPESDWIASLPGVGPTLGPALLACFGRDARRFTQAREAQALMGTAPVTRASGKSRSVYMRRACWKFARRTMHLFADQSRRCCAWAKAFYAQQRQSGHGHNAALRALAHKWIKIILALQRTGRRYDERIFLHSRTRYLLNATENKT